MTQALAPAGVSYYYRRLAELSTLPFWQLPDITEPSRPKPGHIWHWQNIHPELARSRDIADDAAVADQMLFPGESARVHAHSVRFGLAGSGARMSHKCPFAGR
jgi:gentisate 1,2-dioxygenase